MVYVSDDYKSKKYLYGGIINMDRKTGVKSIGIRCPIIRENDNLKEIVVDSVLSAAKSENIELHDKDVVAITESIVARAQGNYATIDQIGKDIRNKFCHITKRYSKRM